MVKLIRDTPHGMIISISTCSLSHETSEMSQSEQASPFGRGLEQMWWAGLTAVVGGNKRLYKGGGKRGRERETSLAQLLCRILQQWAMPTLGPSPKSKVGITHFQLLCQFMVGKVPKKWSRCQVEQVSCGSCKSMNPPPLQLPHQ